MSDLTDFRRMVHDPAMKKLEELTRERDSLREALEKSLKIIGGEKEICDCDTCLFVKSARQILSATKH